MFSYEDPGEGAEGPYTPGNTPLRLYGFLEIPIEKQLGPSGSIASRRSFVGLN